MKPSSGCSKAFTLVEALVVMAVISLLVALLMPALAQARKAALQSDCLAKHRSLMNALFIYAADANQMLPYLPTRAQMGNNFPGDSTGMQASAWSSGPQTGFVGVKYWGLGLLYGTGYMPLGNWEGVFCSDFQFNPAATNAARAGWDARRARGAGYGTLVNENTACTINYRGRAETGTTGVTANGSIEASFFIPGRNQTPLVLSCNISTLSPSSDPRVAFIANINPGNADNLQAVFGIAHDFRGVNQAYIDGHAAWMDYSRMVTILQKGGVTISSGNWVRSGTLRNGECDYWSNFYTRNF